ncbi:MAG: hypothetical protein KBF51_04345 [Chitinophagales bacterium]|nr:hypothetical protein [Chitinophagales bacterium]
MKNNNKGITDIFSNFQNLNDATLKIMKDNLNANTEWWTEFGKLFSNPGEKKSKSNHVPGCNCNDCCPPCNECPPNCLISIHREANAGETIKVPFKIKNDLSVAKTYRIGVRTIYDADGNAINVQPTLDKTTVTLQPGASQLINMTLQISADYMPGYSYETEIVIREKDVNQNICFSLAVNAFENIPVACPRNEKDYFIKWQSWQSHFYCEEKPPVSITTVNPAVELEGTIVGSTVNLKRQK